MTETEWLAATRPDPLLGFMRKKVSHRKLRLYACACYRQVWDLLREQGTRDSVILAEQYADGDITDLYFRLGLAELERGSAALVRATAAYIENQVGEASRETAALWAFDVTRNKLPRDTTPTPIWNREWQQAYNQMETRQVALVRDVINPYHPAPVFPKWKTPLVLELALDAYKSRPGKDGLLDTTILSILADALEDANCPHPRIMDHLRSPGPHVRGCWALDHLLVRR